MANAIQTAREQGIPATFMSGYREGSDDRTYDMKGYSSHGYGLATDVGGIGGAGSKTAQQWNQIAQGAGLHNPYLGTKHEGKEWNHWQLPSFRSSKCPISLPRLARGEGLGRRQRGLGGLEALYVGGRHDGRLLGEHAARLCVASASRAGCRRDRRCDGRNADQRSLGSRGRRAIGSCAQS